MLWTLLVLRAKHAYYSAFLIFCIISFAQKSVGATIALLFLLRYFTVLLKKWRLSSIFASVLSATFEFWVLFDSELRHCSIVQRVECIYIWIGYGNRISIGTYGLFERTHMLWPHDKHIS